MHTPMTFADDSELNNVEEINIE